jgi:hypothetical protein
MGTLRQNFATTLRRKSGESFWVKKTLTSSAITTAALDLTTVATGQLFVKQIIVKSDGGTITGGTNFVIASTNAKGTANIAVETFANLTGAVATKVLTGLPPATDTTTSDAVFSVTAVPTILEAGKKLQYNSTGSAGTGAGTIDVFVQFERIDENAQISAV